MGLNYKLNGTPIDEIGINWFGSTLKTSEGVILNDYMYNEERYSDAASPSQPYIFEEFVDADTYRRSWFKLIYSHYNNLNLLKFGSCPDFYGIDISTSPPTLKSNSFNYCLLKGPRVSSYISISKARLYFETVTAPESCEAIIIEQACLDSISGYTTSYFYIFSKKNISTGKSAYYDYNCTKLLTNSKSLYNYYNYYNISNIDRFGYIENDKAPSCLCVILWAGGGGGGHGSLAQYSPTGERVEGSGGGGGAILPIVIDLDSTIQDDIQGSKRWSRKLVFNIPAGGAGGQYTTSKTSTNRNGRSGGDLHIWSFEPSYEIPTGSTITNNPLITVHGGEGGKYGNLVASGGNVTVNVTDNIKRYGIYGPYKNDFVVSTSDSSYRGINGADGGKGGGWNVLSDAGNSRGSIQSLCNPFKDTLSHTLDCIPKASGGTVFSDSIAGGGGGAGFGFGGNGGAARAENTDNIPTGGRNGGGGGGATYWQKTSGNIYNNGGKGGDGGCLILY